MNLPESLPPFLRDLLDHPPRTGGGVHSWLFRCARNLHAHMEPGAIADLLAERVQGCGRLVPWREIAAAVKHAEGAAWRPAPGRQAMFHRVSGTAALPGVNQVGSPRWPKVDNLSRARATAVGMKLGDLWEASPIRLTDVSAEQAIDILFPDSPLLCCGASAREFDVRPRAAWTGELDQLSLIVPSPMTSIFGVTKEGKPSKHTLANTGSRRYLVCEFDRGTPDDHAALLAHLAKFAPLACAVHSGGKSLHGWFRVEGGTEEKAERFFRHAVSLGADPATWVRSQFVRMPGGRRENGAPQLIYFLNPAAAVSFGG